MSLYKPPEIKGQAARDKASGSTVAHAPSNASPGLKLKNMDEKNMHNLFLKNMSGLIEIARNPTAHAECENPEMDEKNMHNLFLKNMAGLIEEIKNPSPCLNPNSKRGGMATHAGVALELGIVRPGGSGGMKMMSPQMEAILIWCQCRTRNYPSVKIENFTTAWQDGTAFCALIHNFFPQAFDFSKIDPRNRKQNYEIAFKTGERYAGIPDFLTAEDMNAMVEGSRIDPKMVFSYVQEVYRMCNEM